MQATNIFGHGFGEKKFELINKNTLVYKEDNDWKIASEFLVVKLVKITFAKFWGKE